MSTDGGNGKKRALSEENGGGTPSRKKPKKERKLGRTLSDLGENPSTSGPLVVLMFADEAKDPLYNFDLSQVFLAISQTTAKEIGGQSMVFVNTTFTPGKKDQAPKWVSTMWQVSEGSVYRLQLPKQQDFAVWERNQGLNVKFEVNRAAQYLWETTLHLLLGDQQVLLKHNDLELDQLPADYLSKMKKALEQQIKLMEQTGKEKADKAKQIGKDKSAANRSNAGDNSGNDGVDEKSGKNMADDDSGATQRPTESGPGLPARKPGQTPTAGPRQDYVWTATLSLVVPREQTAEGGNPAKRRKLQRQPTERYRWDDPRLLQLKQEADRRLRACYANSRDHRNWRGGPDMLLEEHQAQLKFMWVYAMNEHRDGEDKYLNFLERWGFRAVWQAELVAKGLVPEDA